MVSSQEGTGRAQVRGPQADRAAHSTQSSPAPPQTPLHTSATRRLYLKPASLDAGLGQLQGKTSSVTHQTPLAPLTGPPTLDTLAGVVLPHLKLGWRVPNTPPRSPPFLKLQISQGRTASATPWRGAPTPVAALPKAHQNAAVVQQKSSPSERLRWGAWGWRTPRSQPVGRCQVRAHSLWPLPCPQGPHQSRPVPTRFTFFFSL